MSGWICSYRAIWEHPLFEGCAWRVGVWDWLLKKAAWKPRQFVVKGKTITLQRGQLCVSQRQMEAETGVGRQALRAFLAALESEGAINQKPAHGITQNRTIITICKYDQYQAKEDGGNPVTNPKSTQTQPTKEHLNNKQIPPSEDAGASAAVPFSLQKTVWDLVPRFLVAHGEEDKKARSLVGLWLKESKPTEVLDAMEQAERAGTRDPVPYITEILKPRPVMRSASDIAEQLRKEGRL